MPWTVKKDRWIAGGVDCMELSVRDEEDDVEICKVNPDLFQSEAKAYLIAAAPELLEVAEWALDHIDALVTCDNFPNCHERLKNAVAKAGGKDE